jgi:hypothetical protein
MSNNSGSDIKYRVYTKDEYRRIGEAIKESLEEVMGGPCSPVLTMRQEGTGFPLGQILRDAGALPDTDDEIIIV